METPRVPNPTKQTDGERILTLVEALREATTGVTLDTHETKVLVSVIDSLAWLITQSDSYGDQADAVGLLAEDLYMKLPQDRIQRTANGVRVRGGESFVPELGRIRTFLRTRKQALDIEPVLSELHEITTFAECHLRDHLRTAPPISKVRPLPSWAEAEQLPEGLHPRVAQDLHQILEALPFLPEAKFQTSLDRTRDRLEVYWETPQILTWVICKPQFRWPFVNVRVYERHTEWRIRTFFLAHRIIEYAQQTFKDETETLEVTHEK